MSQTSFPSHTGPIARMIIRRSRSFLATKGWMAPAPRSKPSRSTYAVIMNATAMNQKVSIAPPPSLGRQALGGFERLRLGLGAVVHLTHHEDDVQEAHDQVHPHKADKGEEHVAGGQQRRDTLFGAEEAVGEPGLASQLGGVPP